jgi:hypothetical protein
MTGTAYAPQTIIHIRWPYISFLAIQLGLTIIVLLFTIIATYRSRIQILKGDSLATMCALSPRVKAKLGGVDDMKTLKSKAKRMRVRLERGADREVRALDAVPLSSNTAAPVPYSPVPTARSLRPRIATSDHSYV